MENYENEGFYEGIVRWHGTSQTSQRCSFRDIVSRKEANVIQFLITQSGNPKCGWFIPTCSRPRIVGQERCVLAVYVIFVRILDK
jgi:hypothetical protein